MNNENVLFFFLYLDSMNNHIIRQPINKIFGHFLQMQTTQNANNLLTHATLHDVSSAVSHSRHPAAH